MAPSKTTETLIAAKEALIDGMSADDGAKALGIALTDEMRRTVDANLELLLIHYQIVLEAKSQP